MKLSNSTQELIANLAVITIRTRDALYAFCDKPVEQSEVSAMLDYLKPK